eukprot:TRINITY_DN2800_c0_g1_i2.p1 TRINITY_DN2800_c0_g1~~TRINITY_DN2800_c0_g1_i2.p1  ORF type:complete len:223 (+),score=48.01 TRINITY_DN2800_c0_g1_i2:96-671(+)
MTFTDQQKERVRVLFNVMDVDGGGFIDEDDAKLTARGLATMRGVPLDSPAFTQMEKSLVDAQAYLVNLIDQNGDGKISPDELVDFYEKLVQTPFSSYPEPFQRAVEGPFRMIDTDFSGEASEDEYAVYFRTLDPTASAETIRKNFQVISGGKDSFDINDWRRASQLWIETPGDTPFYDALIHLRVKPTQQA